MVGEGTTAIFITFLLAMLGYAGLTTVLLLTLRREVPVRLWRGVALVILAHVGMVWTFRYEWDFALAIRNGYAGAVLFHGAFATILASTVAREWLARVLIQIAFVIVSLGALGATFKYHVVFMYRVPVILCAIAGLGAFAWRYVLKRGATAETGRSVI